MEKASIAVLLPAEAPASFKGYRLPPDVIWLYYRFPLSLRVVEEMLAEVAAQIRTAGKVVWPGPDPAIMLAKKPRK